MPQINQLADVLYSQFFWLLLTLALIYFGIGRAMVPKIQSTVDARNSRIADDLAAAEAARHDADKVDEAYRARIAESRAEVLKMILAAKQDSARATATKVAAADAAIRSRVDTADARLRNAARAAVAELENIAAEAAQDMVTRLAAVSVSEADAIQAVKVIRGHG
jgi:F-type H+-transporting ATPase subunit b